MEGTAGAAAVSSRNRTKRPFLTPGLPEPGCPQRLANPRPIGNVAWPPAAGGSAFGRPKRRVEEGREQRVDLE